MTLRLDSSDISAILPGGPTMPDESAPRAKHPGGRPVGSKDTRPRLSKQFVSEPPLIEGAAAFRVPPDAPQGAQELADKALAQIAAVMRGEVHPTLAPSILKAALAVREDVCGPPVKEVKVTGSLAMMLEALDAPPPTNDEEK